MEDKKKDKKEIKKNKINSNKNKEKNKKIEIKEYKILIKKLKHKIKKNKEKIKDIKLRSQAEIENINRRNEQNIKKIYKFSLKKFINELLPVVDNLERTLTINDKKNIELQPIMEGIQLTLKSLLDVMFKFGIKNIKEQNIPFNPEIHQAIMTKTSKTIKTNNIIKIMQTGYLLNGRLLRPAMVIVAK